MIFDLWWKLNIEAYQMFYPSYYYYATDPKNAEKQKLEMFETLLFLLHLFVWPASKYIISILYNFFFSYGL